jgi:hypothetical protein
MPSEHSLRMQKEIAMQAGAIVSTKVGQSTVIMCVSRCS